MGRGLVHRSLGLVHVRSGQSELPVEGCGLGLGSSSFECTVAVHASISVDSIEADGMDGRVKPATWIVVWCVPVDCSLGARWQCLLWMGLLEGVPSGTKRAL